MKTQLRTKLLGTAVAAGALIGFAASPALAGDTTTTFTLSGAGLSVSVPASANLSASTAIGSSGLSASLGSVVVTDARGGLLGTWTASVSSTAFTTDGGGANKSIANSSVKYWSGVATVGAGQVAVPVGQQLLSANKVTLAAQRDAVIATGVTGNAVVTFSPTVEVTIPADVVAGTYSGTITHSVA